MEKTKTLASVKKELEARITEGNKIIGSKQEISHTFLAGFAPLEKDYLKLMTDKVFSELKKNPLPMVGASKMFSFPILKKFEVKENGIITKLTLEPREQTIDILKFCEHGTQSQNLDTFWKHYATELCHYMSMITASDLGHSNLELAVIDKSYYMQREARELVAKNCFDKNGKIKVSNKSLVARLQKVIDAILPPADKAKGNVYKVLNCHVNFIFDGFTKLSKKPATISVAKDKFFRSLVFNIMHCLVTGKRIGIDGYTLAKDEQYYHLLLYLHRLQKMCYLRLDSMIMMMICLTLLH